MRFFNFILTTVLLSLISILYGCTNSSEPSPDLSFGGSWKSAGLNDIVINNLNQFQGSIYAATNSGLYQTSTKKNDNIWNSLGLQKDTVLQVVFLPDNKLLAAIRIADCCSGIPSLYLSTNQGESWRPYLNNFGGSLGKNTWIGALAAPAKPSNTLFALAGGTGLVACSFNGGKKWQVVNGAWDQLGGSAEFVYVNPYTKGTIWAGGSNGFFQPVLLKSEDNGKTWETLSKHVNGQVEDLISKYNHSDHVLAGVIGDIRKSTDGGQNWNTVFKGIIAYTLTHSARDPQVVYASGKNQSGTLFFAASRDFGDTWQTVEWQDSSTGIYVNDIVSVMEDGHEVLYLGANKGVYSYRFEQ